MFATFNRNCSEEIIGNGVSAALSLLAAYNEFASGCDGLRQTLIKELFADQFNNKRLNLPEGVYHFFGSISRATLDRMRRKLAEGKVPEGRRGTKNRKGKGLIDGFPEIQGAIKACLANNPRLNPKQLQRLLGTQFELPKLPSVAQIRYWVQNFARSNEFRAMDGERAKNTIVPAFGRRSQDVFYPNQRWEIDSSPTDLFLITKDFDGRERLTRMALIAVIDVYSRRAKILVSPTSRADAIVGVLKAAIADWGIPEAIRMDNGKDYLSKKTQRFLGVLNVKVERCHVATPQEKPHIERFFGTFQRDLLEVLPGFCGHSVAERKGLQGDAIELHISQDSFQEWVDKWCGEYHTRVHSGINRSPLEAIAEATVAGWKARVIENPRLLDFLCQNGESRKVGRQGIQLNNRFYVADRLGCEVGEKVYCCWDADPNKIWVYRDETLAEFICEAEWRDGLEAEVLQAIAVEAKKVYRAISVDQTEVKKQARSLKRKISKDPVSVLQVDDNVVPFVRKESHTTEALNTVAEMVTPKVKETTEEDRKRYEEGVKAHEELVKKFEKKESTVDKYCRLWQDRQSNKPISSQDLEFMQFFESLPEGKHWRKYLAKLYG